MSLLQHLDELGMEISLAATSLSEAPPITHNIADHLVDITMDHLVDIPTDQQTAIEIHHIEDLAAPEDRNWMPIAYAQEKQQFTTNITRPTPFEAP